MQSGPGDLLVLSDLTFSFTDCDEIVISASGGNTFEISVAFWHSLFLHLGSALASFLPTNAKCEFIRRAFSSSATARLPSLLFKGPMFFMCTVECVAFLIKFQ